MEIIDYEKALLSHILRNPTSAERFTQQIVSELDSDKFSTQEHKIIYGAIQEMVLQQDTPAIGNLCRKLGVQLENVGGEPYLLALHSFLDLIKTPNGEGWEKWVQLVDNAGRLRHLGLVLSNYEKDYNDFENLVAKTDDVDRYITSLMESINSGTKSLKTTYKKLDHFVDLERQKMELENKGITVDLIPSLMPSFYDYFIPRPSSFGVITGISSMGKTQLALMIAFGHAIYLHENKLPGIVTINELESVGWRLNRRMACCLAGVDSRNLATGNITEAEKERYEGVLEYFTHLPIYIDDNPDITTTQFAASAIALHLEKGPRKIGISDYLELFTDTGKSEELRVSQAVRQIRKIGWNTGAAEIVISQLNNSVMMTDTKIGGISRTRYSGAIGQAADWFVEVYNPVGMKNANITFSLPEGFVEDRAYILIQKNKDYPTGNFPIEWIPQFTRFKDVKLPVGRVFDN